MNSPLITPIIPNVENQIYLTKVAWYLDMLIE